MGVEWVISYRTSVRRFCNTAFKRSYNQKRIRGLKCPTFNLQREREGGGGGVRQSVMKGGGPLPYLPTQSVADLGEGSKSPLTLGKKKKSQKKN